MGIHRHGCGKGVPCRGGFTTDLSECVEGMYAKSKGRDDPMRTTWALGYDYRLPRRANVYAACLHDRASGCSTGSSAGVGLRTSF